MIRIVITGMREQNKPLVIETDAFVLGAHGGEAGGHRGSECVIQGSDDLVATCLSSALVAVRRAYGPRIVTEITLGVLRHADHTVRSSKAWSGDG